MTRGGSGELTYCLCNTALGRCCRNRRSVFPRTTRTYPKRFWKLTAFSSDQHSAYQKNRLSSKLSAWRTTGYCVSLAELSLFIDKKLSCPQYRCERIVFRRKSLRSFPRRFARPKLACAARHGDGAGRPGKDAASVSASSGCIRMKRLNFNLPVASRQIKIQLPEVGASPYWSTRSPLPLRSVP